MTSLKTGTILLLVLTLISKALLHKREYKEITSIAKERKP